MTVTRNYSIIFAENEANLAYSFTIFTLLYHTSRAAWGYSQTQVNKTNLLRFQQI